MEYSDNLLLSAKQGDPGSENDLGYCYEFECGIEQNYDLAFKWYKKAAEHGSIAGQYNLGRCYEVGRGVKQDMNQALKWYLAAANRGFCDAQYQVAIAYDTGNGVSKNFGEAVKWYTYAAEQGHSDAMVNLGNKYLYGQGVAQDAKKALELYRKSAEQGNGMAMNNIGLCYEEHRGVDISYAKAAEWYEKAGDHGFIEGYYKGAVKIREGSYELWDHADELFEKYIQAKGKNGIKRVAEFWYETKHYVKALEYYEEYEKKIKKGGLLASTLESYADTCRNAVIVPRLKELRKKSIELYEEAVEKGSNSARLSLFLIYTFSDYEGEQNEKKARKHRLELLKTGEYLDGSLLTTERLPYNREEVYAIAVGYANNTIKDYERGFGSHRSTQENFEEAVKRLEKAAEYETDAYFTLGRLYEAKGDLYYMSCYAKAISLGNRSAAKRVAEKYEADHKSVYNKSLVSEAYSLLAGLGESDAMDKLIGFYESGEKCSKAVLSTILNAYAKKAKDDANAAYRLGVMYFNGKGVKKDFVSAVKYYTKASDKGNEAAKYELGICYLKGKGVAKDKVKAKELFRESADLGYAPAVKKAK